MKPEEKKQLRSFLVRAAFQNFKDRPLAERIALLEAAGEVLIGDDAEKARLAAWTLRNAEKNQLTFLTLLKP